MLVTRDYSGFLGCKAAGGHAPERKERIDWMYEGPMRSAEEKEAEANEYLLGKEVRVLVDRRRAVLQDG